MLPAGVVEAKAPATAIPDLKFGDEQNWVEFYGQIDKGVLFFDDGEVTSTFVGVDNANSSTRFGFRALATLNDDMTLGGNFEWEWNPYSTNNVNQLNIHEFDWDTNLLRKLEIYFTSEEHGQAVARPGQHGLRQLCRGRFVRHLGGRLRGGAGHVRRSASSGSPTARCPMSQVKDAFNDFDGLEPQAQDPLRHAQLRGLHARRLDRHAGRPHRHRRDRLGHRGALRERDRRLRGRQRRRLLDAGRRPDAGRRLVLGAARADRYQPHHGRRHRAGPVAADGRYIYGKLGYQTDYFDWGTTAVSVDAYFGQDIDAAGSNSHAIGAQLVQNIDYLQTELYLGARLYDYDEQVAAFDDGFAVLTGARLRF